ncbi:MAG: helix-turn-helix transcriptional regulator [Erysipelotrichia bacterium]|nr:helix-turn-helix transcriptional regulator [Erysipelotrichia bacterium]
MDQKKIGRFIAQCRKENKMTQAELAEKLAVTEKSVSNWENGRNMPDLSLFKPLCSLLNITVNDLISGERIDAANYQQKAEENIINTIDYAHKQAHKVSISIIPLILILIIMVFTCYLIDLNQMKQGKRTIFSTWGNKYAPIVEVANPETDTEEFELITVLDKYIEEEGKKDTRNYYGDEKYFYSYKIYDISENKNNYEIAMILCYKTCYLENNEVKTDSSGNLPCKITIEKAKDKFVVTEMTSPKDGNEYYSSMEEMFASKVLKEMENYYFDGSNLLLDYSLQQKINLYYHLND